MSGDEGVVFALPGLGEAGEAALFVSLSPFTGLFRTERMDFYDEKRPLCQMRPLRQGVRGRARPDHL